MPLKHILHSTLDITCLLMLMSMSKSWAILCFASSMQQFWL